jgi:hypothetical protein
MIGFIEALFTITLNYNKLQRLTINLQWKLSSSTTEDFLHSHSRSLSKTSDHTTVLFEIRNSPPLTDALPFSVAGRTTVKTKFSL